jgi:hypothetical protein
MNASKLPPPKQSSCANCTRELPLKLVLADNGRRYWLCGGCEAGMCKRDPFGAEVARLPANRWSENDGPRPSPPSGSNRAPSMDEQERRLSGRAEPEDRPLNESALSLAEEIESLKRKWGSR